MPATHAARQLELETPTFTLSLEEPAETQILTYERTGGWFVEIQYLLTLRYNWQIVTVPIYHGRSLGVLATATSNGWRRQFLAYWSIVQDLSKPAESINKNDEFLATLTKLVSTCESLTVLSTGYSQCFRIKLVKRLTANDLALFMLGSCQRALESASVIDRSPKLTPA